MMGWDVFSDWAYEGGAFCLQGGMSWALQMGAERARLAGDVLAFTALRLAARNLPLNEERTAWPAVLQRHGAYTHYADWIGNPAPGGYWDRISPAAALAGRTSDVPMLHVGGWYDPMLDGTLGAFRAMKASRAPQRLIVGPWGHIPWGRRAGILDFGTDASSPQTCRTFGSFVSTISSRTWTTASTASRRCGCSIPAPSCGVISRHGPNALCRPGTSPAAAWPPRGPRMGT